jgi:hypothetical protein
MAVRDVQLASTLVCGLGWAGVGFRFKGTFETTLASLSGQHAEPPPLVAVRSIDKARLT